MKAAPLTFIAYLLCLFFIGVGYVAITPAFEPFDENAHYAAMRQVADTGSLPLRDQSFLPRDVANYQGPMPYSTLRPPFDAGLVAPKFFTDPARVAAYQQAYRTPASRPTFVASDIPNWQAQHPPLYYMVMAPVLRLTNGLSFVSEILVLRVVSLVLALAGVALAHSAVRNAGLNMGFAVYPLLLPMFFPAFARIGNDCLCLFFAGALAFCLTRSFESPRDTRWAIGSGIAVGLGLSTKALFLPIAAAVFLFLLVRTACSAVGERGTLLLNLAAMAVAAFVLGAPWYVHHYLHFGEWSGGNEALRLSHAGGLLAAMTDGFSVFETLRGLVVAGVTWIWAGSWSLARIHPLLYLPLVIAVVWVMGAFVVAIRKRPVADPLWLTVLLLVVFGAGLLWHIIITVALDGTAATMGTYLHLLLPWVAPAFGVAVTWITLEARRQLLFQAVLVYAAIFHALALWAQFALFMGCAWKAVDKYVTFPDQTFCLNQMPTLAARLAVVGWPSLALVSFAMGIACAIWIAIRPRTQPQL